MIYIFIIKHLIFPPKCISGVQVWKIQTFEANLRDYYVWGCSDL